MERRKCYVVQSGCVYEGGGMDAVSLTFDRAEQYALKMVDKAQKEDDESYEWVVNDFHERMQENPEEYKEWDEKTIKAYLDSHKHDWTLVKNDDDYKRWSNGMDYISVISIIMI